MKPAFYIALWLLLSGMPAFALDPLSPEAFLADAIRPGLGATISSDQLPAPQAAPQPAAPINLLTLPAIRTPNVKTDAAIGKLIKQVAREHKLDPQLLHAIVAVESGYNPQALSPKGAQGLMQLMPDTASRFGVSDRADPLQSLRGGARYLRFLQSYFKQDMALVIAAYNAGEGAVGKFRNTIPPYRETREYVAKVLALYEQRTGQPLIVPLQAKPQRVHVIIPAVLPL